MSETKPVIKKISIRDMPPEERKKYYRDNKRKSRLKDKRCKRCNAQATVKTVPEQEYLCDQCEKLRLIQKYSKKKE